jgi:putative glutamine amidotransferase
MSGMRDNPHATISEHKKGMDMRRPIIGITCGLRDEEPELFLPLRYTKCVEHAGGIPVAIPILSSDTMRELLSRIDGVVVIGGADLPPDLYGEENTGSEALVPRERAGFDLALIRSSIDEDKPLLGICYGHQAVNVAFGGKLIQDISSTIPTPLKHRKLKGEPNAVHEVRVNPESSLSGILGEERIDPVSSHHQSVVRPGDGFRIVAHAPDGVIEASERTDRRFLFTVQWHPEMTPDAEHSRRLFRALVEAAERVSA